MAIENPAYDAEGYFDEDDEAFLRERRSQRSRTYFTLFMLALAVCAAVLWNRVVVQIESGHAGILYRYFSGTDMSKVYGEGIHIIWPYDRMFIYDIRWQTKDRSYRLLTKDGLPVDISVAIRYRPDIRMLPLLHVSVGPNYVSTVVFPEIEAVLRRAVGQYSAEDVYASKRGFLESIVVSSLTNVENRYVKIDDVLVRSVTLPKSVRDAIEKKIMLRETREAYAYRLQIAKLEAQRKTIQATGIRDYQNIIKQSLTPELLQWQGIEATSKLAASPNAKTVIIGGGKTGLPLILGGTK